MNEKSNILIVEDDTSMREFLSDLLTNEGYEVDWSAQGDDAKNKVELKFYDIVITDVVMPGTDGIEVLKYVKDKSPDTSVIVITGYSTIKQAVELVKMGADDYFNKPFDNDDLLLVIKKTLQHKKFLKESNETKEITGKSDTFPEIVGKSEALQPIFEMMKKVAETDATVLIQGESGTGKELVARAIHDRSPRREYPLIPVNCGAIPETLLESELFGHEKGAFTGAIIKKHGLFEIADKGTIFLDEIGEMSFFLQVKLLRVLETGIFRRIGDIKNINIDSRIIAATNKNLKEAVDRKEFREDLYYRLNVFPINLPPLRERKEDIHLLVQWFLKKNKLTEENISISDDVYEALNKYNWPGNVRELANVVERAGILSLGKEITLDNLPIEIKYSDDLTSHSSRVFDKSFKDAKIEFEKTYLEELLKRSSYDIARASKFAGVSRAYVYEMLKKYNIDYKKK
ncbi:MAG: sigma-54-dependent transcriptional regulator [Candidatus Scalinduaceae bacterium]